VSQQSPSSSASAASAEPAIQRFFDRLSTALAQGDCEKLMLSNHHGADATLQRILGRPIVLRGEPCLSLVWRHQTRDITKNLAHQDAIALLRQLIGADGFRNAHCHTPTEEVQLAFSKKGKATLRVGKVTGGAQQASAPAGMDEDGADAVAEAGKARSSASGAGHNRDKHRFLERSRPFLHELGVTDAQGHLIPSMSRKWKQINKFVEVFSHALERSPLSTRQQINVVDFGSGKGYLTFAIHDWLRHTLGREAQVTGVELREDLVKLCQGVIGRLGLQGMDCEQGDVRQYHPVALNVMIALHACDVATDHAIHLGIRAGAEIIMCSPCCHKQIRPQLLSPHPLRPILQHGIHLGQEAEMLTDGLRALLLDAAGYDTQVFEFISLEHTNKNKMILAVKRAQTKAPDEVIGQIAEIKAFYGIQEQCLESLLKADGLLPA
jgi:hypothetical protein